MADRSNSEHLSSRGSGAALVAALVFCPALPYLNTLVNGFVYDDTTQVLGNPYLRNFHHLREIFLTTAWSYRGGAEGVTNYYRPLMNFVYLLCYQAFGPRPLVFHLVNVLLHVAVTLALFKITEMIFRDRTVAFLAAALFALHPIHSESVAWIAAITDLELTFFCLLTFWFFLRSARPERGLLPKAQAGVAGSFILALLSKEQALALPLLATVYEHLYRDDREQTTWAQKLARYGSLWLLAAAYVGFRIRVLGAFAPSTKRNYLADYEVYFSGVSLVGQYLGKLLWPMHLSAYYVFHETWNPLDRRVIAGCAALLLYGVLFVVLWKTGRLASFGLVWLLATLGPVLNAQWMPANVFQERYLYLPSVGFCWLFGWGCARVLRASDRQTWRRSLVSVLCALAALCVIRIMSRNPDWHDDERFFTRALESAPDSFVVHNNLGLLYWNRDDWAGAEREWLQAEKCAPDALMVLDNLGLLYTKLKRYDDAVRYLDRALQLSPNDTDAHINLGITYNEMGNRHQAETQFGKAVSLSPLNVRARLELGELYFDEGRLPEAEQEFHRSFESEPTLRGCFGLALVYWRRGDREQAERAFKNGASLVPSSSRVHFMLGLFYGSTGRIPEAVREYQAGFKIDPDNQEARAAFQKLTSENPDAKR